MTLWRGLPRVMGIHTLVWYEPHESMEGAAWQREGNQEMEESVED